MNCKICKKPVTGKPRAEIPGKFAWCSPECWKKEGELVIEKTRNGEPFEWNPRAIRS